MRRLMTMALVALCVLGGALGLTGSPARAVIIHQYLTEITEVPAEPGVESGPFEMPVAVASDSGNLYVLDEGRHQIRGDVDEFNSSDGFVKQIPGGGQYVFGVAVSHATGEVYVAERSVVRVFGAAGALLASWKGEDTPAGSFGADTNYVAVDNSTNPTADPAAGDVYVAAAGYQKNGAENVVDVLKPESGGKERYLTQLTGTPGGPFRKPASVAVDAATGDLLVAEGEEGVNVVNVFRPKASNQYEFLFQLTGPPGRTFGRDSEETEGNGSSEPEVGGLAFDASGDIYVAAAGGKAVYEFTSTGEYAGVVTGTPSGAFKYYPTGVVVGSTGDLYVADPSFGDSSGVAVDVFGPNIRVPEVHSAAPSAAVGVVTLKGAVNPGATTVTVCKFEYGTTGKYGSTLPCAPAPGSGTRPVPVTATLQLNALQHGVTYHYRLVATDEEGETVVGQDEIFFTPPSVVGSALASGITSFAATLTGLVEPGGFTSEDHFVYGLSSAYGSSMPQPDATTSPGGLRTVVQTLSGLEPDTTYHFALVATNFSGIESVGPDATFTTRPLVPPAVVTGGAEAIGQTTATVTGSVDAEGLPTTYRFEYGPSAAYGLSWPLVQVFAGSGSVSQAVAVGVPNLQPGATYHYRLVASNEDGTSYGADRVFVTPAYPVSVVQETPMSAAAAFGFVDPEGKSSSSSGKSSKGGRKSRKGRKKSRGGKSKGGRRGGRKR